MLAKLGSIFLYLIPIILMIGLIPFIKNDYLLAAIFASCILALLSYKREKHDVLVLCLGFVLMTFFEYVFVSTGEETFARETFLGVMPLWLPFLWGYSIVSMKRCLRILDT